MDPRTTTRLLVSSRFTLALFLLLCPLVARAQNVYVEPYVPLIRSAHRVPPGHYLPFELTLEAGARLAVDLTVQGGLNQQINVFLVDLPNWQRFTARQQFRVFQGTSDLIRGFTHYEIVVPLTSPYYLVLDNRRATLLDRVVNVYAYVIPPKATPQALRAQAKLQELYEAVKREYRIATDFGIAIRRCGSPNAYSDAKTNIHLCLELLQDLNDQRLQGALVWIFFHELAHTLLKQWDYPLPENEDVADEMATVFLLMGNGEKSALEAVRWFQSVDAAGEARRKVWADDRHSLSPQRAKNIVRWINQKNELLRKWQKLLLPNMQTGALQKLERQGAPWVDRQLVEAELARR